MYSAKVRPSAWALSLGLLLSSAAVWAKLPPLSDEARAKADAAKAKTAWSGKVAAYKLCLAQDRVVAAYKKQSTKSGVKPANSACTDPGPYVAAAPVAAGAAVAAPPGALSAAKKP